MHRLLRFVLLCLFTSLVIGVSPSPGIAVRHTVPTVAEPVTAAVVRVHTFRLRHPADYVAAYWRGHAHARVSMSFSTDGTHFAAPTRAGRDDIGRARANGVTYGSLLSAPGAVAVRVVTDRAIPHLTVLGLGDGSSQTQVRVGQATAAAATAQPSVISRSGWGADPALMTWAPQFYPTKKLIVHHTDTSNNYTDRAGAEAQIRSIYYYHSVTQDWGDIGYNFLIDKFGNVYEGRYSRDYAGLNPSGDDTAGNGVTGAHASGWNSGTVGIAMLGTFTDQDVSPAAREALEQLLAWEAGRNGIDPTATQTFVNPVSGASITTPNIAAHRNYGATACPGDAFYATLPVIRSDVAARLSPTPPPSDTSSPTAPSSLSATSGKGRIVLKWSPSTDNTAVSGYQVWRSRSSTTGYSLLTTVTATTYADSSVARRVLYYYKVRAFDAAANQSPFSASASAKSS